MMRLSNGNPVNDPLGRGRPLSSSPWQLRARKALDTWELSSEISVAAALRDSFEDGVTFAADFLRREGQPELVRKLREAAEEEAKRMEARPLDDQRA